MRTNFDNNPLIQKCISFGLKAVEYAELLESKKKFVIANQMLKSATSIGANALESQSAESKSDFIHKLKIADKEAFETWYWFQLCKGSSDYSFNPKLENELEEIMKLLNAIIKSSKRGNGFKSILPMFLHIFHI